MSYQYAQYGEGFNLLYPEPPALRFNESVTLRGETIKIIQQTQTNKNLYGQPVYTETSYIEKAFIENAPREQTIQAGYIKQGKIIIYLRKWAPIQETGYELEHKGNRYHITGIDETTAYLKVTAERKTR
jgi:hypothetical protein